MRGRFIWGNREKEERRKLYNENKELYRKVRAKFKYDLSKNSRQKGNNEIKEVELLAEETYEAYEEE